VADPLRVATFNTELSRDGPGLLLRDILRADDPQVTAVIDVITANAPDILLLNSFDYDLNLVALTALRDGIAAKGHHYPYMFALRPNSGLTTGLDMDGDGFLGGPRDNQGYGRFAGQGGMALLSRYPIETDKVRDFSSFLWRDLSGALLPMHENTPFPSPEAQRIQRLSSVAHWDVPIAVPQFGTIHLLAFHATPPVFDGPEDRNGRRNHDEVRFWQRYLDGALFPPPPEQFIILGDANIDPTDGDGLKAAINALLADQRLQDPMPKSNNTTLQNPDHSGDPALDTVDWSDPKPGNLRVDYILPSANFTVLNTGIYWPNSDAEAVTIATQASRHRLVWVDLLPPR